MGHHPAYSKGHLNSEREKKGGNNKEIIKIIKEVNNDKQKIHIYMCGHEHYLGVLKKGDTTYNPIKPLSNPVINDNVLYVISGCGGGDADIDPNKPDDTPRYGFFEFIVENDELSYKIHKTHQIWRNNNTVSAPINF